ncbi:lytic transglycosylase domain-containing protein [Thermodesulfobacteriota bacterium]
MSRRKIFAAHQIQCLLFLGMLQYMLMVHLNISDAFFTQEKVKPADASVPLKQKPTPPVIEKDKKNVFNYQIKKAEPLYNPIILEAANLHNVDITMVKAIIMAESSYNKRSVSAQGAVGLMQLMPGTARSLGVKNNLNPEENIHAGVKYYKSLLSRFNGDEKLALAAYNAGARNVRKYKGIPPFKETRQYIEKVLEYRRFYRHGPAREEEVALLLQP